MTNGSTKIAAPSMTDPLPPVERICRTCGQPFTITPSEQLFFAALANKTGTDWTLPARCEECRAERRKAREVVNESEVDVWLVCCDCGVDFLFGGRDRVYFAFRGFARPRRCRPCRTARTVQRRSER
jgi:hypothetical protein